MAYARKINNLKPDLETDPQDKPAEIDFRLADISAIRFFFRFFFQKIDSPISLTPSLLIILIKP